MSFSHRITVAAVALLPLAATAQQTQQPNPADANAAVVETSYVSAFKNYSTTPEETTTPDQVWRAANEEVAGSDPHAGHAGHGAAMAAPRADTQAATPKATPSQPDPHAGHSGHDNMQGK